jgi:hypothetical protein
MNQVRVGWPRIPTGRGGVSRAISRMTVGLRGQWIQEFYAKRGIRSIQLALQDGDTKGTPTPTSELTDA